MQLEEHHFDNYITELDSFAIDIVEGDIHHKGLQGTIESLLHSADCTVTNKDGVRLRQTIDYTYKSIISKVLYCISKLEDNDTRNDYYNQLVEIHKNNLLHEAINPPVVYPNRYKYKPKTKAKVKTDELPRKRSKQSSNKSPSYKDVYLNTNLVHTFKLKSNEN